MRSKLSSRGTWAVFLMSALAAGALWAATPAGDTQTRATMREIFVLLAELLPESLDPARFGDPTRARETLEQLDFLVQRADQLESHASSKDPGFHFIARSLQADLRQIRRRYARGRYDEARFFLSHLTENCVACHSRMPAARDFPFSERLLARIDRDRLSPAEYTRLLVATRQFEPATEGLEKLMADPSISPAELDLAGHLHEYLVLSLRVRPDPARARTHLEKLAKRSDTPLYLSRTLESWTGALSAIEAEPAPKADLATARAYIQRGDLSNEFPADQRGVVYSVMATRLLHQFLDGRQDRGNDVAEAYYLLGIAEAGSRRSPWLSEAEFYLETSIRTAPSAPVAPRAYALLEEYTVLGFAGSAGVNVPPEVQARLDELRALIETRS